MMKHQDIQKIRKVIDDSKREMSWLFDKLQANIDSACLSSIDFEDGDVELPKLI